MLHFRPSRGIGEVFFVRLQWSSFQQSRQIGRSKNHRSYQMWEHRSCRIGTTSSDNTLQHYHKRKSHFLKSNPEQQAQQHFVSTC
jgi:hypothetical protein